METNNKKEFGTIRSALFPIHGYELKKFAPLALLFFCISYNYSVLRGTKDIFILGKSGAAAIYYLKAFGVTPAVFIFTIAYSYLSKTFGRDGRFNSVIIYFIAFFSIFLFLILPNLEALQLNSLTDSWESKFPKLKGLWAIIRNWHTSLFYIHSEAWGSYALSVLFWTFANEITNLNQSKRFYGFLAIGANLGAISAGLSLKHIFRGNAYMTLTVVIGLGVLAIIVYNYLSRAISSNPSLYQVEEKPKKKSKAKLSFAQSMAFLFKSPYLLLIAILVLSYGMSISLFEAVWKDRVQVFAAGNKEVLSSIYGDQLAYIGAATIILIIFLSPWIKKKGWTITAMVTPLVFIIGSIVFFAFMLFGDYFSKIIPGNMDTLGLAVYIGLGNVVFIKAAKYAFFDPSKEMAYIPLDEESKVRGKSAVDGVGGRLGKSLGSLAITFGFLQISNIFYDGSIGSIKSYIAVLIVAILIFWIISVINLGIRFRKVTKKDNSKKE